jgi:hypothetical protein
MDPPRIPGVFCDCAIFKTQANIAVVCAGKVDFRSEPRNGNSHHYERLAIHWAKILYPCHPRDMIFSDDHAAARKEGVSFVPREQNRAAHNAARGGRRPYKSIRRGPVVRIRPEAAREPSRLIETGGWSLG